MIESHDSCYSSCSEESHSSLSRELSDNVTKEIGKTETATADLLLKGATDGGYENNTQKHITFAIKLGYSVEQLQTVLEKLGTTAGQVFATLIHLFNPRICLFSVHDVVCLSLQCRKE